MGVTISATNSKYSFDMGGGGFFNLRSNIASALDAELGDIYRNIIHCHTSEMYKENDRVASEIINSKRLDDEYEDVLDFLYMSDIEGKIGYKTCKKIYDLIKDIDFGTAGFQYAMQRCPEGDYEVFKRFLKDCYSHKRNMIWS